MPTHRRCCCYSAISHVFDLANLLFQKLQMENVSLKVITAVLSVADVRYYHIAFGTLRAHVCIV